MGMVIVQRFCRLNSSLPDIGVRFQVSGLCPTDSELYRSKGAQLSALELSFSTILFALSVLVCLVGMYRLMMSECGNTET